MPESLWLQSTSPAFRLMIATSWLAAGPWHESQNEAIARAIDAGADWSEFLTLVDRHRTPALSWAALSRVPGITIPESFKIELQKRSNACRMNAVKQCLLLYEILKAFNSGSITSMPFKGQLLSHELYGDVGLRHSRDLDLAVMAEDLDRAKACLEVLGWKQDASTWFTLTPRQWRNLIQYEHHLDFTHTQTGTLLELHWRDQWETPEATSARWRRSKNLIWQGNSVQTMTPADLTLYLCCHGGDHAWFRAKWLGDLARAYVVGKLDWDGAFEGARRSGQDRVLFAAQVLLDRAYGFGLAPPTAESMIRKLPLLIDVPLHAIATPPVQGMPITLTSFRNRLRMSRYKSHLWPQASLRSKLGELFHCREDYKLFPLPDSCFWAYKPLRPLLWIWKWMNRSTRTIH